LPGFWNFVESNPEGCEGLCLKHKY
jgi:hypothetical protein